jgi:diguanylate cyclase (GGDEF)-like protein/PAS domain S-box-containing protein
VREFKRLSVACMLILAIAMLALGTTGASARDLVNAALRVPSIDLMPVLEKMQSDQPEATIKVPQAKGPGTLMNLQAKGPGPVHRWAVVSMLNPDPVPHDLVLVVPHQTFAGSGLFLPRQQGSRLFSVLHSGLSAVTALHTAGADAYAFRIEPGEAESFALEMTAAGLHSVTLQQRMAFDAATGNDLFYQGLLIGIAVFITLAVAAAAVTRFKLAFAAGTVFAVGSLMFMAGQAGYLPGLAGAMLSNPAHAPQLAAISEAVMAGGLCLLVLALIDLRQAQQHARHGLIVAVSIAVGLVVYGFFAPGIVGALARLLFAAAAICGFVLAGLRWQVNETIGRLPLILFSSILLWTLLAGLAALDSPNSLLAPVLPALLMVLVLVVVMGVLQPLFGAGLSSARYDDSGRRALALAGAGQAAWDWHAERGVLHVGPELDRALGLESGTLSRRGVDGFLENLHPADRSAYLSAVETAEKRGRGTFSQRFRMKRRDGSMRWYMLRARAMPGNAGRAARLIGALSDITDLRIAEERILNDAVHDRVTGLPNRALFIDRLDSALKRGRNGRGLDGVHVLIIDLDRFKTVNEGLGHEIGDSLLSVTAKRLQGLLGPEDTLARLFGDQFGILFEGAHPSRSVNMFIENLRRAISRPVNLRPREVFLTASVGAVAVVDADREALSILKDAEIALYEAKRRGKDQVEYFRADMTTDRSEFLSLENDLRRALERKEIEVLYQPIYRLKSQELVGFEALMRWHHPQAGEMLPERFVPVAEETGLIRELGNFVLSEAGRQLGSWQRSYRSDPPLFVAVNVSSSQLLSSDLVDETAHLIKREDLSRGSLRIEVTEAVVMQNPELSAELLTRLKALGAGVACDDFGTGYSSLGMLRRLPFDTIKIDRSFVAADESDERASVILENIVRLAHDLDMASIAEGIENRDQLSRLVQLKCDLGQGYYFGEALPARKVAEKLSGVGQLRSRPSRIASFAWNKILGRDSFNRGVAPEKSAAPQGVELPRVQIPSPQVPLAPKPMAPRAPLVARAPSRPYSPTRVKPVTPREADGDQSANDLLVAFKSLLAKNAQRAKERDKE